MCNFERITFFHISGDYGFKVTPVPIPNTKVKLEIADGTAGAALWKSRLLPGRKSLSLAYIWLDSSVGRAED